MKIIFVKTYYFSSDSVLCTSYAGGCNVGDYPMMTATTESVFLNLLVKNEPEDLTGHRERQGDFFLSLDTYAVSSLVCRVVRLNVQSLKPR